MRKLPKGPYRAPFLFHFCANVTLITSARDRSLKTFSSDRPCASRYFSSADHSLLGPATFRLVFVGGLSESQILLRFRPLF